MLFTWKMWYKLIYMWNVNEMHGAIWEWILELKPWWVFGKYWTNGMKTSINGVILCKKIAITQFRWGQESENSNALLIFTIKQQVGKSASTEITVQCFRKYSSVVESVHFSVANDVRLISSRKTMKLRAKTSQLENSKQAIIVQH